MKQWENLPEALKKEEVKPYYKAIKTKGFSLFLKQSFRYIRILNLNNFAIPRNADTSNPYKMRL